MKTFFKTATILVMLITIISVIGCFQYPDGPIFTLQTRSERLNGTWRLTSATDPSGNDATSEFQNITLTAISSRSGDNTWTIFQNGNLISLGSFLFASHGDELIVIYSLLGNAQTYTQEFYQIQKLTDKEFNYIDQNSFELHYEKY
jgi:hypothetical protein